MNKIKLVIFDMDGLMVDSETVYLKLSISTAKQLNIKVNNKVFYEIIGRNINEFNRILSKAMGEDNFNEFKPAFLNNRSAYFKKYSFKKKKGLIPLLKYLKRNNIKIAVATSTKKNFAIKILKNSDVLKYVDYCLFGDQIKNSKPAPDIYLKVLKHYKNIKAKNVLVFEDSKNGLLSAIRAKLKCVVIKDISIIPKTTLKRAYKVYPDLNYGIKLIKELNK